MSQDQEIINAQLNLISSLIESTNAAAKKGIFLLDLPLEAKETLKTFTKDNDRYLAELRTISDIPTLLSSLPKAKASAENAKSKLQLTVQHPVVKDTLEASQSTLEGITNIERLLESILRTPSTDDNSADLSKDSKKKKKEKRDKKERRSTRSDKKGKKSKRESTAESGSDSDSTQDSKSEFTNNSKSEFPPSQTEEPPTLTTSISASSQEQQPSQIQEQPSSETETPPSPRLDSKEDHPTPGKGWKVGTWGKSGERTRSPSSTRRLLNSRGENEPTLGTSPRSNNFVAPPSTMESTSPPRSQFVQPSTSPSNSSPLTSPKPIEIPQEQPTSKEPEPQQPAEPTPTPQTTHEQTTTSQSSEQPSQEPTQVASKATEPESKPETPKESPSPLEVSPLASPASSPRTAQRRGTTRGNSDVAYRSSLMITPQQLKEVQMSFQSPIADVNAPEEEEPQAVDNVQVEVVVTKEQPKPLTPVVTKKPVLEELLLFDKNGGFDLEDWNYKLDSLIRACSVTINNHTTHDLQLAQHQHENFEWLNPPPAIIPAKRKVIFGTFSRNLFGNGKANIFYSAEGIEDKLQFTWDSQKSSTKIDKIVAYVNFPFKCEKEFSQKRKHTEITFTITESEIRPRASTFGTGLEL